MKKSIFLTLALILQLYCNSQEPVKVCQDLELIQISSNAFVHVSYVTLPEYGRTSANGLIFINNKRAFLFDTPWTDSLTCGLISYLRDQMGVRVAVFIPNHWHEDCMGGLNYIKSQNIKSCANQLTIDIAKSKGLPLPDQGFSDSVRISLGDKSVYCYYPGAAHSIDNIVVWIPSERILFPGCMCKSLESDNLGNISDGDPGEYQNTIDKVIQKFKSARVVIPGHGRIGGTELLIHTRSLAGR